ncbi:MAG: alpha/beta fold hydrolase [Zetaproteobacteria bacterium]|nr:MAG: alpha/beta fold hydrolase [Zetaproteobacteria bacterium]
MNRKAPVGVRIPGPAGALEGLWQRGQEDLPGVVVCHPHPLYGGTMRNKVVYWIARAFQDAGCSVLRFNFRGVEKSEGAWDEGRGEVEDALSALSWMQAQGVRTLWLAGFSFGGYVALSAFVRAPEVAAAWAVAPAVEHFPVPDVPDDARPVFVVAPGEDEIVPFEKVLAWSLRQPVASLCVIPRTGHFFPGKLDRLYGHIRALAQALIADDAALISRTNHPEEA